jgi:hypothetical protein
LDDKVVKIIEPTDTVYLTYNPANENRLAFVKTDWANYHGFEINQINKLNYGDYLNSQGQTDNVVVSVEQRTEVGKKHLAQAVVTREYAESPEYKDLNEELQNIQDNANS